MLRAVASAAARPAAATRLAARTFHASAAARADIIGIDLGTTNSCVAIMEVRGRAERRTREAPAPPARARARVARTGPLTYTFSPPFHVFSPSRRARTSA
jgi:hypothetical protein